MLPFARSVTRSAGGPVAEPGGVHRKTLRRTSCVWETRYNPCGSSSDADERRFISHGDRFHGQEEEARVLPTKANPQWIDSLPYETTRAAVREVAGEDFQGLSAFFNNFQERQNYIDKSKRGRLRAALRRSRFVTALWLSGTVPAQVQRTRDDPLRSVKIRRSRGKPDVRLGDWFERALATGLPDQPTAEDIAADPRFRERNKRQRNLDAALFQPVREKPQGVRRGDDERRPRVDVATLGGDGRRAKDRLAEVADGVQGAEHADLMAWRPGGGGRSGATAARRSGGGGAPAQSPPRVFTRPPSPAHP